jgi:hypothetical protein
MAWAQDSGVPGTGAEAAVACEFFSHCSVIAAPGHGDSRARAKAWWPDVHRHAMSRDLAFEPKKRARATVAHIFFAIRHYAVGTEKKFENSYSNARLTPFLQIPPLFSLEDHHSLPTYWIFLSSKSEKRTAPQTDTYANLRRSKQE